MAMVAQVGDRLEEFRWKFTIAAVVRKKARVLFAEKCTLLPAFAPAMDGGMLRKGV
jgi:hypothetical protein